MEQLVYEEYDTEEHEVLAIVLENEYVNVIRVVPVPEWLGGGVLLGQIRFLNCYSHHTSQEDVPVRSFVMAVSAWAEKWTIASCVNILSQDKAVVRNIGIKHS